LSLPSAAIVGDRPEKTISGDESPIPIGVVPITGIHPSATRRMLRRHGRLVHPSDSDYLVWRRSTIQALITQLIAIAIQVIRIER
jgi:hypothetical protein